MRIAIVLLSIILFSFVLGCANNNPIATPSDGSIPTTLSPGIAQQGEEPPLPFSGATYVEWQWVIEGRTANLMAHLAEGYGLQEAYTFDKPVDIWFRDIDDEVINICGRTHYPPHKTEYIAGENVKFEEYDKSLNPIGTHLYYYMHEITAFSYIICLADDKRGEEVLAYYLHIKPSQEGATVNVTVRRSDW